MNAPQPSSVDNIADLFQPILDAQSETSGGGEAAAIAQASQMLGGYPVTREHFQQAIDNLMKRFPEGRKDVALETLKDRKQVWRPYS